MYLHVLHETPHLLHERLSARRELETQLEPPAKALRALSQAQPVVTHKPKSAGLEISYLICDTMSVADNTEPHRTAGGITHVL